MSPGYQTIEAEVKRTPCTVVVLGPGSNAQNQEGWNKRKRIARELRRHGFDVVFPEERLRAGGDVPLLWAEVTYLRNEDIDFVIVLNHQAPGVLAELSVFNQYPELVQKMCVLHPEGYLPTGATPQTVGADVLASYPNRLPYASESFSKCNLVNECVKRAKAVRFQKFLRMSGPDPVRTLMP